MRLQTKDPEAVVKEMMWLAWQACGSPQMMWWFQDRPDATKDQVWTCMLNRDDYPGASAFSHNKLGKVYADYVFGRMMKLGLEWDEDSVTIPDGTPRSDYQSWCRKYQTYQALYDAAVKSAEGQ